MIGRTTSKIKNQHPDSYRDNKKSDLTWGFLIVYFWFVICDWPDYFKNQKSKIKNQKSKIKDPMSKASHLEDRLINFSVNVFTQTKNIANAPGYRSLVDQVRRSAASPALNYGEAQSAESTNDFIHKLGIVVKELRETHNALRILAKLGCIPPENEVLSECNDLIAIFVASVKTAQRNRNQKSTINNKK